MWESSPLDDQVQISAKDHFMRRSCHDCKELLLKKIMKTLLKLEGHDVNKTMGCML